MRIAAIAGDPLPAVQNERSGPLPPAGAREWSGARFGPARARLPWHAELSFETLPALDDRAGILLSRSGRG